MHNGTPTIKGDRVSKHKHEKGGYRRVGRTHGSFYRRFSLPDSAASDNIQARSNNGVLELFIPRQEQVKAKKMGLIYITRRRYNKAKERGRGRPKKYEIEQIDASPEELARAVFETADAPESSGNDDGENPISVWLCI